MANDRTVSSQVLGYQAITAGRTARDQVRTALAFRRHAQQLVALGLDSRVRTCDGIGMSNPPAIAFTVPYAPVAVGVLVLSDGVQADGTNPGVPDTTSPLVLSNFVGTPSVTAVVDPSNNRRVIVTAIAPPIQVNSTFPWSFRISVAGKANTVTVSGTTAAPTGVAGVTWDEVPVGPA